MSESAVAVVAKHFGIAATISVVSVWLVSPLVWWLAGNPGLLNYTIVEFAIVSAKVMYCIILITIVVGWILYFVVVRCVDSETPDRMWKNSGF